MSSIGMEISAFADAAAPSARGRFDPVTVFVHWTTVGLLAVMFATAFAHHSGVLLSSGTWLFVHRSCGAALWVLTALRLVWRSTFAQFPEFPSGMPAVGKTIVAASERLLYALLLVQPLTGLLMTLLRGRPFLLFGWEIPALLPKDLDLSLRVHDVHEYGAYFLLCVVAMHAVRGLVHHYVLKDDLLRAMLPRK